MSTRRSRASHLAEWDAPTLRRLTELRNLDKQHHLGIDCVRLARLGWTAQDLVDVANRQGFRVVTEVLAPWACHSPDFPKSDLVASIHLLIGRDPRWQTPAVVERTAENLRAWVDQVPVLLVQPALAAGLTLEETVAALHSAEPPTRDGLRTLAALAGHTNV